MSLPPSYVAGVRYCPDCGLPLTPKEGSLGPFWGCTGFPACRYAWSKDSKATFAKARKRRLKEIEREPAPKG